MSVRNLYNQWLSPQKWLERAGVRPAMQIAIGLVVLAGCSLLFAQMMGLLPNDDEDAICSRMELAESTSERIAGVVGRDDSEMARAELESLVQSQPDLMSAGLRQRNGYLLAHTGRHGYFWKDAPSDESNPTHIRVPIFRQKQLWGELEMVFAPLPHVRDWPSWLKSRAVRLVGFTITSLLVIYWIFLSRVLRVLDPSQAVPDRMQILMDTLVEGMVILDTEERIVMTNQAFAQSSFEAIERLMGRPLSALNWVDEKGKRIADGYPWKAVQQSDLPERGVTMRLQIGNRHWRRLNVNAAPILDQDRVRRGVVVTFGDQTIVDSNTARLRQLVSDMSNTGDGVHELHARLGSSSDEMLLAQLENLAQSARELSSEVPAMENTNVDEGEMISSATNKTDSS